MGSDELLNLVPLGRKNAISSAELSRRWCCDAREVRRRVARLRAADSGATGVLLSGPSGYWRSEDLDEIRRFVRSTSSRARSCFLSLRGARRALKRLEACDDQLHS